MADIKAPWGYGSFIITSHQSKFDGPYAGPLINKLADYFVIPTYYKTKHEIGSINRRQSDGLKQLSF